MKHNQDPLPSDGKTWSGLDLPVPADMRDLPQPEQCLGFRSDAAGTLVVWLLAASVVVFVAARSGDWWIALCACPVVAAGLAWYVLVARRRELRCEPDGLHYRMWHWHEQVIPWSDVECTATVEHVRPYGRSWATFHDLVIRFSSGQRVRFPGSTSEEPASRASESVLKWRDHYLQSKDDQIRR